MESINIIISAAKSRLRVKCKQSCTSSFRISYFEGRKHMSMLSAIILAILLLASCSKNASESSFHDAREALDAQKVFLSRMKSDKDLSMEHLANKISKWRTLEDSVSACLMRDTIKKAHSFPLEEFSNVHDSIRDEFMRIATAKRRTFKDVLLLKMNASPYKGKKETDSLSLVASKFFESMDTIPLYKGDNTRILTTYHFFLEKVKKEGIANQSQFLAFLENGGQTVQNISISSIRDERRVGFAYNKWNRRCVQDDCSIFKERKLTGKGCRGIYGGSYQSKNYRQCADLRC